MSRFARVGGWLRILTPAGWAVLLTGLALLWLAHVSGLAEVRLVGAMFVALFVCCVPFMLLPSRVRARLALYPPRTIAGERVKATLKVFGDSRWPILNPLVHVPTGTGEGWMRFPTLRLQESVERTITIETHRRGVLQVGPLTQHLSDPLGLMLLRREWVEPLDLYVRPRMVSLEALGNAQIRDLEGNPTNQISMSDLAFHALREYVRGDDLRHVHWRSSARAGELLVRQYHDSRRTQASVLIDPRHGAYRSDDEYELAVEIAASLAASAARIGHDLNLISGVHTLIGASTDRILDALCRVDRGTGELIDDVRSAQVFAPQTSVLLLVTGSAGESEELFAPIQSMPSDVEVVVLRAHLGGQTSIGRHKAWSVRTVAQLADLPGVMATR